MTVFRWATLQAVALGAATLVSTAALAQAPAAPGNQEDMMKMIHQAARNQLGVIEYCQAQGSVGQDVVDLQKRMLAMLPPAQVDGLDAAEAAGKQGMVQFGGAQMDIKQAAAQQNTTADAMCKKIGDMLKAQAAQLPK